MSYLFELGASKISLLSYDCLHCSYFLSCIVFHLASCLKQFAAYIAYKESLLNALSKKVFVKGFSNTYFYRNFAIIRIILRGS
ncbi:hypothetical protein C2S02_02930 [Helicobacter pylori]|nr:hypothetical protein C2S02_02930 [Helicobacter pylori]